MQDDLGKLSEVDLSRLGSLTVSSTLIAKSFLVRQIKNAENLKKNNYVWSMIVERKMFVSIVTHHCPHIFIVSAYTPAHPSSCKMVVVSKRPLIVNVVTKSCVRCW